MPVVYIAHTRVGMLSSMRHGTVLNECEYGTGLVLDCCHDMSVPVLYHVRILFRHYAGSSQAVWNYPERDGMTVCALRTHT